MTHTKANLILVFVAMVWGGGFIATSKALESFSPFYTIMIRFGIAGIVLGILSYKDLIQLKKKRGRICNYNRCCIIWCICFSNNRITIYNSFKKCFFNSSECEYLCPILCGYGIEKDQVKKPF